VKLSEADRARIEALLAAANGKRKARTLDAAAAIALVPQAAKQEIAWITGGEANDGNQVTTVALAVKTPRGIVVGVGVGGARGGSPGRAWGSLQPWSKTDTKKNLARCLDWAAEVATDRMLLGSRTTHVAASDERLLADVLAAPDDDRPRLVYADWLAEKGDARGELIQLQCELAKLGEWDERRFELEPRVEALLAAHGAGWAAGAPGAIFRRGFVDEIRLSVAQFVKTGAAFLDAHPIRCVRLSGNVKALGRAAHLARVRELGLRQVGLDDATLAALAASPHFRPVVLDLGHNIELHDVAPLAGRPIEQIDLTWCRTGDAGARILAKMKALRVAFVGMSHAGPEGVRALVGAKQLRRLDVSQNRLQRVAELPPVSPSLEALDIGDLLEDDPLERLLGGARLVELTAYGTSRKAAIPAIASVKTLRRLNLTGTRLDASDLQQLARLPLELLDASYDRAPGAALARVASLRALRANGCGLAPADVGELAALARLVRLELVDNPRVGVAGARLLADEKRFPALRTVELDPNAAKGLGDRFRRVGATLWVRR
jgi:uncharacterized protein (TIGR02996 family)